MIPIEEIFAAIRWWLILLLLGTAVTPLTFFLLKKLPDKGYAFTKMLGLLSVSYLFWLGGSLGLLQNELGSILIAILGVLALSFWAFRQEKEALGNWLRHSWRTILLTELVFLLIFVLWVWVRSQNPAIAATEKPMDFAFLNAISRSPTFPPLDPWLSGFAISYYYFGYLMNSVLARLTAVPEPIAFNLAIAWLVAGTAVGAYGLVYNLIANYGEKARRAAIVLGLVAAIAIPIAGNLEIILEALHGNNMGSAEFWAWLDVKDINSPPSSEQGPRYDNSFWWWWRASRPINEYSLAGESIEGLEPIAEFPSFSFILGDLHPHVMALPFALLSLAIALAWWLREEQGYRSIFEPRLWSETSWNNKFALMVKEVGLPFWLMTAVVLGGLSFLNTWDVLIHLFIVVGAFTLAQWRTYGWSGQIVSKAIFLSFLLTIPAFLLYLPFYIGFRSQAGAPFLLPMLNRPTRLVQFLIIFGLPLGVITLLLLILAGKQRFRQWRAGMLTAVSLIIALFLLALLLGWVVAASAEGAWRVTNIASEAGISLAPRPEGGVAPGWAIIAVATILPTYLGARFTYPGLTIFLAAIAGLAVMILLERMSANRHPPVTEDDAEPAPSVPQPLITPSSLPFVLLLIITGALLTLGPEFVYLRDNFGVRLNTIFKFYYQAWVLFGTTAVFGLYYLWRTLATGPQKIVPALVTAGYAFVFLLSLLFPFYAIQSRTVEFRGQADSEFRLAPTLNGLAQVQQFNPDEYAAIMWLRENVTGTPVIVESVGGQYSQFGRISASTGLPTLLGWAGHEYQWRGDSTREPDVRDPAVRDIYTNPTLEEANTELLLDQYNVELIYVGSLEQSTYGLGGAGGGLEKFQDRLEIAYQNPTVTIYRWLPNE